MKLLIKIKGKSKFEKSISKIVVYVALEEKKLFLISNYTFRDYFAIVTATNIGIKIEEEDEFQFQAISQRIYTIKRVIQADLIFPSLSIHFPFVFLFLIRKNVSLQFLSSKKKKEKKKRKKNMKKISV